MADETVECILSLLVLSAALVFKITAELPLAIFFSMGKMNLITLISRSLDLSSTSSRSSRGRIPM